MNHLIYSKYSKHIHFNEFAAKMQIKPHVSQPIVVHEQIIVEDDEPEMAVPVMAVPVMAAQAPPQLPLLPMNKIHYEEDPGPSISQRGQKLFVDVTPPRSLVGVSNVPNVVLPVPDRVASRPASTVGANNFNGPTDQNIVSPYYTTVTIANPSAPLFAVDQTNWNDLMHRVSNQECEVEKIKGHTKRYQLQFLQLSQNMENQRIQMNDDLKKTEDKILEYTQVREFECKHYTDKRLKDELEELSTVSQQVKVLERNLRKDNCATTLTGLFVGVIILSYLFQWMNQLLNEPEISFYTLNYNPLPPS